MQVNENMDTAQTNAVDAHENIEKAATHQKSGNKWLKWILIVMGCFALGFASKASTAATTVLDAT